MTFSEHNPFPLLSLAEYRYSDAQEHAHQVDEWLGFQCNAIEQTLQTKVTDSFFKKEQWIGLDPSALQTPYLEFRLMLSLLNPKPGQSMIDFGAAYGRLGIVSSHCFPEVHFTGYELCRERVEEGVRIFSKLAVKNAELICLDLADPKFMVPVADFYFIYDFGTAESIQKILNQLKSIAFIQNQNGITVVGRGRRVRDQIERNEPWLSQVVSPQHCGNFSIYKTASVKQLYQTY